MKKTLFIIGMWVIAAVYLQAADIRLGKPAPDFSLKDANGTTHRLSDYRGKIVVLEWVNYGCPFVNKHYQSGNMQSLQRKYTQQGVVWLSICSSAKNKQGYYEPAEINKKKKELKAFYTAYLIDEAGTVGRLYGAKTTPHMFIIDKQGNLIYAGAIDDKSSTRQKDIQTAHNYVSDVLNRLLAGKPVKPFMTTAYGCSVKYKK